MRHRWLVYLNILENRTKIITKINKIACIPLFFRIWSKLAAHLHLHMHVKKFLSSNSQMYVLYSIQFLSCVWNHPKRDRSLEIHERWKKNLLRKKKCTTIKKNCWFPIIFYFSRSIFFCICMCLLSLRINNSKIYTPNLWVPIRIYHTPG